MIVWNEINIQESSINQKSNNTMSVMVRTRATFVKKNSRLVSFDTAGLHLFTFRNFRAIPVQRY